jgi:PiT family inorganic phosphate transporter
MDVALLAVIGIVAMALLFDFTNGFHDAANSVATVVATRVLPAKVAVWFAAFFNFVAIFFVGAGVANTVAKTVKPDAIGIAVVFAAVLAATTWNFFTWWIGMPSSSSHALIGGLVGAGLGRAGFDAVTWKSVEKTVIAIVASPFVAFTVAFVAMFLIGLVQKVTGLGDNSRPFKLLQLVSAAAVSFGHGANDAQKTMGVIAALLVGTGYLKAEADGTIVVPFWVEMAAYSAIAAGTIYGGWKIIETMGLRITKLHASSGLAANIGATTAIFGATDLGIPISTTHAAASSVTGAGVSSGAGANWKVVGNMVVAWMVTIPATVVVGWGFFELTQFSTVASWIAVSTTLAVLGGLGLYAVLHAVDAEDVEAEIPPEEELAEHLEPHVQLVGSPAVEEPAHPHLRLPHHHHDDDHPAEPRDQDQPPADQARGSGGAAGPDAG